MAVLSTHPPTDTLSEEQLDSDPRSLVFHLRSPTPPLCREQRRLAVASRNQRLVMRLATPHD
jgi:hypothetical protein